MTDAGHETTGAAKLGEALTGWAGTLLRGALTGFVQGLVEAGDRRPADPDLAQRWKVAATSILSRCSPQVVGSLAVALTGLAAALPPEAIGPLVKRIRAEVGDGAVDALVSVSEEIVAQSRASRGDPSNETPQPPAAA